MTLQRRSWMRRGKPPQRKTWINRVNRERRAKLYARNFGEGGERGEVVRSMACLARGDGRCSGPIEAAHVVARGMGGCNSSSRQLVPLCRGHHREQGDRGIRTFEARHGLDLDAEARRVAEVVDERIAAGDDDR